MMLCCRLSVMSFILCVSCSIEWCLRCEFMKFVMWLLGLVVNWKIVLLVLNYVFGMLGDFC